MKTILHLFPVEKFTGDYIFFMNENSIHNHTFWVYGETNFNDTKVYLQEENVKYFPRIDIKLNKESTIKQIQTHNLILYHGVFDPSIIDYFYRHKILLKKTALYFWGGDIPLPRSWREKIKKKYIIRNAASIITIIPADYRSLKEIYHPKGQYFCARYYSQKQIDLLNKVKPKTFDDDRTVNIQVGNSATDTNNHIDILKLLSKFKEENIKIYLPLSYGDAQYAEKIIKYGKELFGDKLVPLQQFVPFEEYFAYLTTIDIAIFDMERQQALGNIFVLFATGCKIFFHPKGKLNDYFEEFGFSFITTDKICDMSKEDFLRFSEKEKQNNRKMVNDLLNKKEQIKSWERIFAAF